MQKLPVMNRREEFQPLPAVLHLQAKQERAERRGRKLNAKESRRVTLSLTR